MPPTPSPHPNCHHHSALTSRKLFVLSIHLVVRTSPAWKSILNFLLLPGTFDSRRIFEVCRDSGSGCYSANAHCSSEPECALRFCSSCGSKMCSGTINSACFPPAARRRAEASLRSHCLTGCHRSLWSHNTTRNRIISMFPDNIV